MVSEGSGILIEANAESYEGYEISPQYCFYYSYNGGAYVKLRTWGDANSVLFKPTKEGEYVFKVQARNAGRTTTDAEWISDAHIVYLGGVPAKSLAIALDKAAYEYGEAIKLNIKIEEGRENQQTQYRVYYAKSGSTRYYSLTDWDTYHPINGQTSITTKVFIPANRLNMTYIIKVVVATVGRTGTDLTETTEADISVGEALGSVALTPLELPTVEDARGVTLSASALNQNGAAAHAEYRFAYRVSGTRGWKYIARNFGYNKEAWVLLAKEGTYDFRVEARAAGSTVIEAADEILGVQVYYGAIPAQSVSVAVAGERIEYLVNQAVTLDVSGVPCDDDRYGTLEYCVLYSTNGRSYKALPGYGYGEYDGIRAITLPMIKRDTPTYLKVGVRTEERKGTDAISNAVLVKRYLVLPADEVRLTISGENPQVVIPETGVELMAQGYREGEPYDCTYQFYYRLVGSKRWSAIRTKDILNNSTTFIPKKEGVYEFYVQATAVGRRAKDIASDISPATGLYFGDLPAAAVELDLGGVEKALYGEAIVLNITASDNGKPDTSLEYQVLVSTNRRQWTPLAEYKTYQPLTLVEGAASTAVSLVSTRDKTYYIRVNVRTAGRLGADVWAEAAIDMYTVMPIETVALNDVIAQEDGKWLLSAEAQQASGYEDRGYTPQYRFYYRASGTGRWRAVNVFNADNTCTFAPTQPAYDFKVLAVNAGRRGCDALDEQMEVIGLTE